MDWNLISAIEVRRLEIWIVRIRSRYVVVKVIARWAPHLDNLDPSKLSLVWSVQAEQAWRIDEVAWVVVGLHPDMMQFREQRAHKLALDPQEAITLWKHELTEGSEVKSESPSSTVVQTMTDT